MRVSAFLSENWPPYLASTAGCSFAPIFSCGSSGFTQLEARLGLVSLSAPVVVQEDKTAAQISTAKLPASVLA